MQKRKKKAKLLPITIFFFLFCTTLYSGSRLFLRSYNNSISQRSQKLEAQISSLQVANDSLSIEVSNLTNSERVRGIADDESLSFANNIVITITAEND